MTYAEIANRLGVSGEAARQVVRRRGWHRIVPNRPGATTVVIVPADELPGLRERDTQPPDGGDTRTPDGAQAFDAALTAIREAHAGETEALRSQLDRERERADRAEQAAANERARADQVQQRVDAADADRRAAEARADRAARRAEQLDGEAEALRAAMDQLRDGQTLMAETHARDIAEAIRRAEDAAEEAIRQRMERLEHDRATSVAIADEAVKGAEQLRQRDAERRGQGRWARLRAAWRGE